MTQNDSPEPKFRRRAEDRPDELLDAALALFVEQGYAATSVAQIARAAGLSKGAVYLYFPSKQAILEGLVRRAVTPIAERAFADPALFSGDIRIAMRSLLTTVAGDLGTPGHFAVPKIVIREAVTAPEIAEMYRHAIFDRILPLATQVIQGGIDSGQLRPVDPEMTLRTIMGPVLMHLILKELFGIEPKGGLALDRLIDNHFDILLNGLFAQPEPKSDA